MMPATTTATTTATAPTRALYLGVCLPLRLALAVAAYLLLARELGLPLSFGARRRALAAAALALAAGCAYQAASGARVVGAFGQPVWWASLRWAHALLYGAFAALALGGAPPALACAPLVLDVGLSLGHALAVYARRDQGGDAALGAPAHFTCPCSS